MELPPDPPPQALSIEPATPSASNRALFDMTDVSSNLAIVDSCEHQRRDKIRVDTRAAIGELWRNCDGYFSQAAHDEWMPHMIGARLARAGAAMNYDKKGNSKRSLPARDVNHIYARRIVLQFTNSKSTAGLSCGASSQGVHMKGCKSTWMIGMLASATIAGCASTPTGVRPAGQDAYHVSVFGARYETQADTNLKALSVANQYCDQQDKHVMFRQSTESSEHAWSPKQEDLTFVCMDAKDPSYMRAAVEHAPPPVVAQQE